MSWFPAVRAGYGALLLLAPGPVVRLYTGHPTDRPTRVVARVLGARHLLQGLLSAGAPGPTVLVLGVEADIAHVASMLGVAALDPARRRAGLVDAIGAGSFAAVGLVLARRGSRNRVVPRVGGGPVARLAARRKVTATMLARWALPASLRHWVSGR
ncbi:MAG: hypothetical protein JO063_08585 [Pseudonocardiales bacterium]|nr:hypothetical protein [Pseudonocardiales bacterium]